MEQVKSLVLEKRSQQKNMIEVTSEFVISVFSFSDGAPIGTLPSTKSSPSYDQNQLN